MVEQQGKDQWLSELRAEEPDAAAAFEEPEPPPDLNPQPYHGLYWRAWAAIRFDRQYGALGGESRLPYLVIRQYAADHNITGEDLQTFHAALRGMDEEWLLIVATRSKTGSAPP